jgi:hypothetical protein
MRQWPNLKMGKQLSSLRGRLSTRVRFCIRIAVRFHAQFAYKGFWVLIIFRAPISTSGRPNLGSVRWFVPNRPAEPNRTEPNRLSTEPNMFGFFSDPICIMILRASLLYFRVGYPREEQNKLFLKMQKMLLYAMSMSHV